MLLDLIEEYIDLRGFEYERLDGSVTGDKRQAAIDRFSHADSKTFLFLLGTRAGGVGINLTAADTVIIYDPDWNPQNDIQAMARCHRIGQTRAVQVYKLVTRDTYEMHMLATANQKLGLEHAVMKTGGGFDSKAGFDSKLNAAPNAAQLADPISKASEIERLLRTGAQVRAAPEHDDAQA